MVQAYNQHKSWYKLHRLLLPKFSHKCGSGVEWTPETFGASPLQFFARLYMLAIA